MGCSAAGKLHTLNHARSMFAWPTLPPCNAAADRLCGAAVMSRPAVRPSRPSPLLPPSSPLSDRSSVRRHQRLHGAMRGRGVQGSGRRRIFGAPFEQLFRTAGAHHEQSGRRRVQVRRGWSDKRDMRSARGEGEMQGRVSRCNALRSGSVSWCHWLCIRLSFAVPLTPPASPSCSCCSRDRAMAAVAGRGSHNTHTSRGAVRSRD